MERTRFPHLKLFKEITPKCKRGQPLLHMTHCLDRIFMPTKYNQNNPNGNKSYGATMYPLLNSLNGNNSKIVQGKATVFARDAPS